MNRLANSPSSYLRRAADEPIDWYPWCDEAFEHARREDKPVLLSIGATWCHWCHVMARDTWHDPETVKIIDRDFIAIKVDRDDRPELDKAYQEAVQALTGHGGWPLTVFLTPDRQPFYGGTYFPGRAEHGMPAFKDVLLAISDLYRRDRGSIERVTNDLSLRYVYVSPLRTALNPSYLDTVVQQMDGSFDHVNGGFGTAPKFPYPESLLFLLQRYEATGDRAAWQMADFTLRRMAVGGIYDQVGGGFHRYATDAQWRVPHFEKMLNDNAMLLRAYLEAYQLSGFRYFRQVAEEIVGFVFRDLTREPAGFASSVDADVHGVEGAYFVWAEREIRQLLGDRADQFIQAYHVAPDGNFERGKNILWPGDETNKARFAEEKRILLGARNKHEKPYVDQSIHTSWTALMITSLVTAYNVLDDRRSLDYALRTADFVLDRMYRDGMLYRTYTDAPAFDGYLEDYSCLAEALLEIYNTTQKPDYLDRAIRLIADCDERFFDREKGGYFFVQAKDRTPMMQDKPITDFSVPGSNPQMAMNLIKLYYYTDNEDYLDRAQALVEWWFESSREYPVGHGTYFSAFDYLVNRPEQVAIVALQKEGMELVRLVNGRLIKKIVTIDYGQHERRPSVFEGKAMIEGKPTAYFCKDSTCTVPLTDQQDILEMLKRPRFTHP